MTISDTSPPAPVRPALALFALATLLPVGFIVLSVLAGGPWGIVAVLYMTLATFLIDEAVPLVAPATGGEAFPAATGLSVTLALAHFAVLALVVAGLAGRLPFGADLGTGGRIATFLATALFVGQISNANAHELIHRPRRALHRLGMWVFISHLYGHHTSAHPLVHHVHVATRADPATARLGEGFWRFARRSWRDGFREGRTAEAARLSRARLPRSRHPYRVYALGAAAFCLAAFLIGGLPGLALYLALAVSAQMQLLMSDYVQHYGLIRAPGTNGRPEPVGTRHSWNSPHLLSSALMLNAPRHSDHHAHPSRPYPALRLADDAPLLPRSLPAMSVLALWPRMWRRVMDPRVHAVREG